MSPRTPSCPSASGLPWWLAPSAIGLLAACGALVWDATRPEAEPPPIVPPVADSMPDVAGPGPPATRRFLPPPGTPVGGQGTALHWVGYGVESGVKVLYVQVTPSGDVLVLDPATGRLIETRPAVPSA